MYVRVPSNQLLVPVVVVKWYGSGPSACRLRPGGHYNVYVWVISCTITTTTTFVWRFSESVRASERQREEERDGGFILSDFIARKCLDIFWWQLAECSAKQ